MTRPDPDYLRSLPSVDELLGHPELARARAAHPRFPWTPLLRDLVAGRRDMGAGPGDRSALALAIVRDALDRVEALQCHGLRPVLNGTGVILHTNLGRAPLGPRAVAAAARALAGYTSLEVDLASGERARRGDTLERLFCLATGAEAALVVNNNAAAVYLVANSFSPPGRVIVSRGELVEIGGSFRLPEILRHAAAEVIEVGTTNRTYAADYEKVARAGDLMLKVHKSNYAIEGFAHEASIDELVEAARRRSCALAFDLGSGALFDFAGAGVGDDPVIARTLAAGVDAVTMSGDKLLGGVQAGIVLGSRVFIERLRQNPLRRAVRVDKVTVAALQEVVRAYLFEEDARAEIPVVERVLAEPRVLRERAERVSSELQGAGMRKVSVAADDAVVGGGSLSAVSVSSVAVVIECADERDAVRIARALRLGPLPVFTRVRGCQVRVNMMTILTGEEPALAQALRGVLTGTSES